MSHKRENILGERFSPVISMEINMLTGLSLFGGNVLKVIISF